MKGETASFVPRFLRSCQPAAGARLPGSRPVSETEREPGLTFRAELSSPYEPAQAQGSGPRRVREVYGGRNAGFFPGSRAGKSLFHGSGKRFFAKRSPSLRSARRRSLLHACPGQRYLQAVNRRVACNGVEAAPELTSVFRVCPGSCAQITRKAARPSMAFATRRPMVPSPTTSMPCILPPAKTRRSQAARRFRPGADLPAVRVPLAHRTGPGGEAKPPLRRS